MSKPICLSTPNHALDWGANRSCASRRRVRWEDGGCALKGKDVTKCLEKKPALREGGREMKARMDADRGLWQWAVGGNKIRSMLLCVVETIRHKIFVLYYSCELCIAILWRAMIHDMSKFTSEELPLFASVTSELKNTTYDSDEYKAFLRKLKPALDWHYNRNAHHPEHYPAGVMQMNMLDVIEMWCDWRSAIKRHANGDIQKSITANDKRFGLGMVAIVLRNQAEVKQRRR